MQKRFASIWFRYLITDWFSHHHPEVKNVPFVLVTPDHGRMIVVSANHLALKQEIRIGMPLADAKAIIPSLTFFDHQPGLSEKLLKKIAEWCIRYTPLAAIDPLEGIILDITGCAHLWGGEKKYLEEIRKRFNSLGYYTRIGIADTVGVAWAIARFGKEEFIIETGQQITALLSLPPASLRIEEKAIERLQKLGLRQISSFINMPRSALRRRFGAQFLQQLNRALGYEEESIQPVIVVQPYQERLPCLEPIVTAKGIEIALQKLVNKICERLNQEEKGLRLAKFTCFRVDGKIQKLEIGTHRPSANSSHLLKLFENKIETIEPALGIELFILEALQIEDQLLVQERLWNKTGGIDDVRLSELLDRISGKFGGNPIRRYLPDEHYWPERSFKLATSLTEKIQAPWKVNQPRPIQLLSKPEPVEVTAPVPDYPPMLFRYKGKLHKIAKADGPERIEAEWWLQDGRHRDYYYVEDEEGCRYWLFRSGHYDKARTYRWFVHGFFT